jgi:hypothetical protein
MANINVWSKVAVAVQSALATAKTVTGITKASPAVATSTAHGFVAGDIALFKVSGMAQLDYQVVRILAAPTADTVSLEGIDSTLFDTFTSGTMQKVTLGTSCSTLQDINASGGEASPIQISTIHTDQDIEIPGNRTPIVYSFGSLWDSADAALLALAAFDKSKTPACLQLTFATGAKIFFCAYVSNSMAPVGSAGGPVTTPVTFRLRGPLTTYAT